MPRILDLIFPRASGFFGRVKLSERLTLCLSVDLQKLSFHLCFYLRGFEADAAVRLCRHVTLSKRL